MVINKCVTQPIFSSIDKVMSILESVSPTKDYLLTDSPFTTKLDEFGDIEGETFLEITGMGWDAYMVELRNVLIAERFGWFTPRKELLI